MSKKHDEIIARFEAELRDGKNPTVREYIKHYGKLTEETLGALVMVQALYDSRKDMELPAGFAEEQMKLARALIARDMKSVRKPDAQRQRSPDPIGKESNVRYFVDLPPPLTREVGPLPILSLAAAGEGQEYIVSEYGLEGITRPFDMAEKDAFGVEVRGDSMAPLITEGSFVATKPSAAPHSGDIALIETTGHRIWVKQVFLKSDKVIMRSFNPAYPDRECLRQDILHMYKVIWIRRK